MKVLKFIGILLTGLLLRMGIARLFGGDPIGEVLEYRSFILDCHVFPAVLGMLAVIYGLLLAVYLVFHRYWPGKPAVKGLVFGALFGLLWAVGMVEASLALKTPLMDEILFGLGEVPPILIMGLLAGLAFGPGKSVDKTTGYLTIPEGLPSSAIVVLALMTGRYFSYAVIKVDSTFAELPAETFFWTLAFAATTGLIHLLLGRTLPGSPAIKGLLFGFIVFGINWLLYTLVVPFLFQVSLFEAIRSYIIRILVDCLAITFGILLSTGNRQSRLPACP